MSAPVTFLVRREPLEPPGQPVEAADLFLECWACAMVFVVEYGCISGGLTRLHEHMANKHGPETDEEDDGA